MSCIFVTFYLCEIFHENPFKKTFFSSIIIKIKLWSQQLRLSVWSTYILRKKILYKWYHYCHRFEHIGNSISRVEGNARAKKNNPTFCNSDVISGILSGYKAESLLSKTPVRQLTVVEDVRQHYVWKIKQREFSITIKRSLCDSRYTNKSPS